MDEQASYMIFCACACRVRRYGEHSFESKAEKYGFDVAAIPGENLHADYRCGGYRLIQLTRRQSCSI